MTKHVHFLVFGPFLGELLIQVKNFLSKQHVLMRVFLALRAGHLGQDMADLARLIFPFVLLMTKRFNLGALIDY